MKSVLIKPFNLKEEHPPPQEKRTFIDQFIGEKVPFFGSMLKKLAESGCGIGLISPLLQGYVDVLALLQERPMVDSYRYTMDPHEYANVVCELASLSSRPMAVTFLPELLQAVQATDIDLRKIQPYDPSTLEGTGIKMVRSGFYINGTLPDVPNADLNWRALIDSLRVVGHRQIVEEIEAEKDIYGSNFFGLWDTGSWDEPAPRGYSSCRFGYLYSHWIELFKNGVVTVYQPG